MKALGNVNLKKSETGAHQVFQRFGQSLDIKISKTDLVSKKDFPYIRFSEWLRHIIEYDNLEHLVGVRDVEDMKKLLVCFWSRWQSVFPQHEVFHRAAANQLDVATCIPILHHGDEGRGYKKKQVMVMSVHGALGRGSRPSERVQEHLGDGTEDDPLRVNLKGNSQLTHFISCLLPIWLYNRTPQDYHHMLDLQGKEYADLFLNGITIRGIKFYVCCLGCKGDSPYLAKAGKLLRSFTRRPTRASSKKAAEGVCHLCCAGKEDLGWPVPFEDMGPNPAWLQTVGMLKPYDLANPSPLLQVPFDRDQPAENFFRFDIFHNWHSGMGKYFSASAVCVVMELIDATIPIAFDILSEDFKDYCKTHKESPYHKRLTASLFGVETGFLKCPDASWSKGDFTRLINQWFADYCARSVVGKTNNDLYLKCAPWLYCMPHFF